LPGTSSSRRLFLIASFYRETGSRLSHAIDPWAYSRKLFLTNYIGNIGQYIGRKRDPGRDIEPGTNLSTYCNTIELIEGKDPIVLVVKPCKFPLELAALNALFNALENAVAGRALTLTMTLTMTSTMTLTRARALTLTMTSTMTLTRARALTLTMTSTMTLTVTVIRISRSPRPLERRIWVVMSAM
jgi:hypothetical protein